MQLPRTGNNKIKIRLNRTLLKSKAIAIKSNQLVHEMIHAWLLVTRADDGTPKNGYHGTNFLAKMKEVNLKCKGLNITVKHNIK